VCYVQIAIAAVGIMMQMKASADQEAARRDKAAFDAQIAKNNAKILERQAIDAEEKGKDDRYLARLKADVAQERMQAELAGQGFDVTFGSNIDLLAEVNEFGERDADAIKESADQTAFALRARAANFRAQGQFSSGLASGADPGQAALFTGISGATAVASKWYDDIDAELFSTSPSSSSGTETSLLDTGNSAFA
jgi:hypothetical protein